MKKTIAVVFGGRSGEHEISIRSARTVIEELDAGGYDVIPIAITGDGLWLSPERSLRLLPEATRV
jgi:D-alanine-D-alanine ligase